MLGRDRRATDSVNLARPVRDVHEPLILASFVALVSALLLMVLLASPELNVNWRSPLLQTVLITCSALMSGLVGYWLQREARLGSHPALFTLSAGFYCLAVLLAAGAWLRDPIHLAWFGILSSAWTALFATCAALLLSWRAASRFCRQLILRRGLCLWPAALTVFFAFIGAGIGFACVKLPDQASLTRMSPWLGLPFLAFVAAPLVFVFRLYLTRRRSVLMSFILALFLFGLSVASRMLGSTWHLLWWYGHILNFNSLFLVAYGISEGNREREREMLINELDVLSRKLEALSSVDSLTGCYNRRYATEVLHREFRKSSRTHLPLTLLIADLDNFKSINDGYGHPVGDFVLKEFADRLRQSVRSSDAVARCGGEEFWVILPDTNRLGGCQVASKILSTVRSRAFDKPPVSLRVTVSVGVADNLLPGATDVDSLVNEADRALYSAKRAGKDRAVALDALAFAVPRTT